LRYFLNLIINAVEAMPQGGDVNITSFRERDHYAVEIADTGGGIPEEILPSIFQPFFTAKAEGSGLGLFLCKEIAEFLGGRISVKTRLGKGTIFSVVFPVKKEVKK